MAHGWYVEVGIFTQQLLNFLQLCHLVSQVSDFPCTYRIYTALWKFSERFEEIPKGKIHLEDAQEMLNRYRAAIPSNRIDAKTASEMYREAGHWDLYYVDQACLVFRSFSGIIMV